MALVDRDLSEPYSIFTYRYFLSGWPDLCVLVRSVGGVCGWMDWGNRDRRFLPSCRAVLFSLSLIVPLPAAVGHTKTYIHAQAYGTDDRAAQESGAAPLLGVVVGKADAGDDPSQPSSDAFAAGKVLTGYIAMLAVETSWRRAGIGGCMRLLVCRKAPQG